MAAAGSAQDGGTSGMVHISDYGFAHVWEIQPMKTGAGGGSESMIESQDTLSTYIPLPCPNDRGGTPHSLSANKDFVPLCSFGNECSSKDPILCHHGDKLSGSKELLSTCCHGTDIIVPVTGTGSEDMLALCDYNADTTMVPLSCSNAKDALARCSGCQEQTVSLISYPGCKDSDLDSQQC